LNLLQNVAAGFSLRLHRLESLCHRGLIYQPRKISILSLNFARGSKDIFISLMNEKNRKPHRNLIAWQKGMDWF
jgi:hypothetical protein